MRNSKHSHLRPADELYYRTNSIILACAKRAIDVYGSGVLDVLLWDFARRADLSPLEIARYPDEFVCSIREVFGNASSIVEEKITLQICQYFHFDIARISGLAQAVRMALSVLTRS